MIKIENISNYKQGVCHGTMTFVFLWNLDQSHQRDFDKPL